MSNGNKTNANACAWAGFSFFNFTYSGRRRRRGICVDCICIETELFANYASFCSYSYKLILTIDVARRGPEKGQPIV